MGSKISSQVLIVRADVPVRECIRLMNEKKVGSILIVEADAQENLAGIFTERDLLTRFELIQGNLPEPISRVMTHPVITVSLSKYQEAGKIMLTHNFRHLPVVSPIQDGQSVLIGIVSMRDLFREQLNLLAGIKSVKQAKLPAPRATLGLLSTDQGTLRLFAHDLPKLLRIKARTFSAAELIRFISQGEGDALSALVVDLDGPDTEEWLQFIKDSGKRRKTPFIIITFDPARHTPEVAGKLGRLNFSERLAVFPKPIELIPLFERLKPLFANPS